MSQPISVSVQMDAQSFHDFAAFDLLRHHKRWHRPLLFTVILLVFAGICLSQVGQREGAALLTFFHNLSLQIKKMGLSQPKPFYRLLLDDDGLSVWMAGGQDKAAPTHQYPWQSLYIVYRVPGALYLYVQQNQAYLLNDSIDAAWAFLSQKLPPKRLRDCR